MPALALDAHATVTRPRILLLALAAAYAVCQFALLTDGHLDPVQPMGLGLTFNSMLEHLLRGEFDVDPAAVQYEGFAHDGKVYSYWGIFCALVRLPLLFVPRGLSTDITVLSCFAAVLLSVILKLQTTFVIARARGRNPLFAAVLPLAWLYLAFGGAGIGHLRPSIYQEVIFWAEAQAACFLLLLFIGLVRGVFTARLLALMALCAGLALITRVTFGIGLYAGLGLLLLLLAAEDRSLRRVWPAAAILIGFAVAVGVVNYGRWGNPLTFMDNSGYVLNAKFPDRLPREAAYGLFNLERIPYGIDYYFFGAWLLPGGDGQLLFQNAHDRLYDVFELPPAALALTDLFPFAILVAATRVPGAWHGLPPAFKRRSACAGIGLLVTWPLILTAISTAYRYRMEFYPALDFVLFASLYAIGGSIPARSPRLANSLLVAALLSVVTANAGLALYKLSQNGSYQTLLTTSPAEYFRQRALALITGNPVTTSTAPPASSSTAATLRPRPGLVL